MDFFSFLRISNDTYIGNWRYFPSGSYEPSLYQLRHRPAYYYIRHHAEISQILITVCPGISDPPEKIFFIFASENEVYTLFINYYDNLGRILLVYREK